MSNAIVDNEENGERHFTKDDLRDLFRLDEHTISDTHTMYVNDYLNTSGILLTIFILLIIDHYCCFFLLLLQFDRFNCKRCVDNVQIKLPPEDSDCTSDLAQWYHCSNNKGIPDDILCQASDVSKCVSFVFHHRSSKAEVKLEDATEKVGQKKKKVYKDDDEDDDDFIPEDDDGDEDFVL